MHNPVKQATDQLEALIQAAAKSAMEDGSLPSCELPDFVVEIPGDTKFGDFASNVAMVSARAFRMAPWPFSAFWRSPWQSACRWGGAAPAPGPLC